MIGDKSVFISFITELELLSFSQLTASHEEVIHDFIDLCKVAGYDNEVKKHTLALRRETSLKLLEAIIAATSIKLEMPIITADKHFKKVEGLDVIFYQLKWHPKPFWYHTSGLHSLRRGFKS